jgi:hypothetical protein
MILHFPSAEAICQRLQPIRQRVSTVNAEVGIIGDNSTNRQRNNRSTLSIVSYRLALETALLGCRLKTKSDDRLIELSVRTIKRYCRMID